MSFHRENVTWQSEDGTWSLGFFEVYSYDSGDDDYDPEWDVDYDYDSFQWVSTGHPTREAAGAAWDGSNPGGTTVCPWDRIEGDNEKYDDMAAKLWAESGPQRERYSWERTGPVSGTPKRRVPRYLARDVAEALLGDASFKLQGYSNIPKGVTAETAELRSRLPELSASERAAVVDELERGVKRVEEEIDAYRTRANSRRGVYARGAITFGPSVTDIADRIGYARDRIATLTALTDAATVAAPPAAAKVKTTATRKAPAGKQPVGKTTPASNRTSFKPRERGAPDVDLG